MHKIKDVSPSWITMAKLMGFDIVNDSIYYNCKVIAKVILGNQFNIVDLSFKDKIYDLVRTLNKAGGNYSITNK